MQRGRNIEYRQHPDVTPDQEVRLLGAVYAFALSKFVQKKAAEGQSGGQSDGKGKGDDPANGSLPQPR